MGKDKRRRKERNRRRRSGFRKLRMGPRPEWPVVSQYHRRCPHNTRDGYGCPWCGQVIPGPNGWLPWYAPIWSIAWIVAGFTVPLLWVPIAYFIGRLALVAERDMLPADWFAHVLMWGWAACWVSTRVRSKEGKAT